jgi:hypothetical protein
MVNAENTTEQVGAGTAPEQEPTIPKWRMDEVLARLRAREEELEIKNQILNQTAANRNQVQEDNLEG